MTKRPEFHQVHNGDKVALPFAPHEYDARLAGLRAIMEAEDISACVLTSMHNIAYYSGFLYCSFGRPYALVVTATESVTISAGIDAGQPWRRCHGDNLTYTDWQRDNFWRAILSVTGTGQAIGFEEDHLTLQGMARLDAFLAPRRQVAVNDAIMRQRMHKSPAEIALIREGARVADVGGHAIRDAIREGLREIDIAMIGRDAMEVEIARAFPDAEYRDTWVWFQSGPNTDGAHNPVTARRLERGDILSLNTFPMISGYYTALERTLFLGEVDDASLQSGRPTSLPTNMACRCSGPAHRVATSRCASTPSFRSAACWTTAPSGMAIPSACCRITTAARPGWNCARTSTPCSNPAWSSRWSRC